MRLNAACVLGRPTCRRGGSNRAARALHTLSIPLRKSWASCGVGAGLLCIGSLLPHITHQQQGHVGWDKWGGGGGGSRVAA